MIPSKDDTVHTLKNSAQNVRDTANAAKSDLNATAASAGRKVRNFINSTSEEFSHATEVVSSHVHNKPIQSTLIALGVGFVLGALLRS